jgi:hypothetical protein
MGFSTPHNVNWFTLLCHRQSKCLMELIFTRFCHQPDKELINIAYVTSYFGSRLGFEASVIQPSRWSSTSEIMKLIRTRK